MWNPLNFLKKQKKTRAKRSYYSAASMNRLSNDWTTLQSSSKDELKASLRILRARSRDLSRNNDYAKRYFNLAKTNVIGHQGIGLQSKALDDNGELDTYANKQIEDAWKVWGKVGNCDVTRRLSWIDCCKLAIESVVRDGELLAVSFEGPKRGPHNFQIKLIDPDLLDENYNEILKDGREIAMSIEFDAEGIATHYHILKHHPSNHAKPRSRQRIPVERVCHVFIQDRIDQIRGVPQLVSTMARLKMLSGYEEAELVAARASSSKMGFIYDDEELDDDYEGEREEDTGATITEMEPGVIERLRGSQRFEAFDPQHPTTAFKDFVKALLRGVSAGANVSYTDLSNDLEGVSYSSIRQGELGNRDAWRGMQTLMIQHFVTWVYERWLETVLSPNITGLPLRKFDKFNKPSWLPRGWLWVDPAKEVIANIKAVKAGFKSVSQVISEMGNDPEEVFAKLKADKDLAKKFELTLDVFLEALDNGEKQNEKKQN